VGGYTPTPDWGQRSVIQETDGGTRLGGPFYLNDSMHRQIAPKSHACTLLGS
jgi:hypothetical protein